MGISCSQGVIEIIQRHGVSVWRTGDGSQSLLSGKIDDNSPYIHFERMIILLWDLESLFKAFNHVSSWFFGRSVLELRILFLAWFIKLHSLRYIESIWSEKPIDLFFQFRYVCLIKCILKYFGWEDHHSFIEVLIRLLIRQYFRFELHKWVTMIHLIVRDRFVMKHYPWVTICHFLSFLI